MTLTAPAPLPPAVEGLLALKGQFASLKTVRLLKVRKGQQAIEKESIFTCRIGVDYDNIKAVQEKRDAQLLPAENQGLPWGQWLVFPHLIAHKGAHYLRCTQVNGNNACIPKVRFLRNGVEITREEAQAAALASEFQDREDRDVFTVKVESIVEVNGKPV